MEPTDLPAVTKTKKQHIHELVLLHPEYSPREIANMVGTTIENVWKEKSKMGADGLIVRRTTKKITAERKDDTMLVLPSSSTNSGGEADSSLKTIAQSRSSPLKRKSKSDNDQYLRQLNISPVDLEGMKIMYKEFNNKKPVDIIAENGFPPAIVEVEYKRFLRLQDIDIQKLQTFVVGFLKYPLEGVESLDEKYKKSGSLAIDDMIEIIKRMINYRMANPITGPAVDQPFT
jgi:hypothetical protein